MNEDGSILLTSGETIASIDTVILCTGYEYTFDFLKVPSLMLPDNKVSPLYHHLFYAHDPTLSFVGLPFRIIPFPLMELQARWVAQFLSEENWSASLPSVEDMLIWQEKEDNVKKDVQSKHFHLFGDYQFEYCSMIRHITETHEPTPWRKDMYKERSANAQKSCIFKDIQVEMPAVPIII